VEFNSLNLNKIQLHYFFIKLTVMRSFHLITLLVAFIGIPVTTFSQEALPPINVHVDPLLTAHWLPPAKILLDENFEGSGTPAGWQLSSQGQGWSLASNAQIGMITVPSHSQYYIVNDGAAPAGNNGCCDYLITPTLNLSQYSGYHLSFLSFFTGNYGQLARLEISTDNGATWTLLQTMNPEPTWRFIYVDLSAYSGPGGYSNVKLAFHADDQGNQASGWAVDDVYLRSGGLAVQEYQVELNGTFVGNTTETSFQFNPENYSPANDYVCCVSAIYPTLGMSIATCDSFPEFCTPPPQNLADTTIGDSIVFTWSSMSEYLNFVRFNVYLSNTNTIPIQTIDTSITLFSPPGQLCIYITAVYDLTAYGFPGLLGESYLSTTCGFMDGGFPPPFNEDWGSGQFNLNQWEAGSNWSIDGQNGNAAPSVQFTPPPGKSIYESTLASWYLDATNITECSPVAIDLDFDLRLEDPSLSGTENFNVEISTGDSNYTIAEYSNTGSFDWQMIHIDITQLVRSKTYQIQFRTNGSNTGGQVQWNVDNIHVYSYLICFPPAFYIMTQRLGSPENEILVSWQPHNNSNADDRSMAPLHMSKILPSLGKNPKVLKSRSTSLCDTIGYSIYRRAYSSYPPASNTGIGDWQWIGCTPKDTPQFLDQNLVNDVTNCYEYSIAPIFNDGAGAPSGSGWDCIFVGIPEIEKGNISFAPNPADNWVRFNPGKEYIKGELCSMAGNVIELMDLKGGQIKILNTSRFSPGTYIVKFTSEDGSSVSQKLLIQH
jgi:hypothetical protein